MNNPFDFFEKIYCINLPESTTRKTLASIEFKKVGILNRIEWIAAPKPPNHFHIDLYRRNPATEFGCSLSHITAIIQSIYNNDNNILIFEDDIIFTSNAQNTLQNSINSMPKNWTGFYLGYNKIKTRSYNKYLSQPQVVDCTHGYALNGNKLLDFFKFWTYGITHGLTDGGLYSPIDTILSSFLNNDSNSFCAIPPLVNQNKKIISIID